MDIWLLLLRLTLGLTLAAHGTQKLFGWFGGPGLDATGQFFEMIGFIPGRRHAVRAGLAETGGGLLLALGLITPVAAALLFSVMLVAAVTVHIKKGFFAQNGGYEYNLVLGIAALTLAFTGPGSLSLDVQRAADGQPSRQLALPQVRDGHSPAQLHLESDVMPNLAYRANALASLPPRQRGVVLFIALIVMVVMSLAALGLLRTVDTTTAVLNNLALRQAAILPANYAVEDAAVGLFADAGGPRIADIRVDNLNQNYYASHSQAAGWDDQYGVPKPLQTKAGAQALKRFFNDAENNRITYITERMCTPTAPVIPADNSAAGSWCDMMQPKQSPGTTVNQGTPLTLPQQVFYRVTVRVDGPQNTVSFLQAMLR